MPGVWSSSDFIKKLTTTPASDTYPPIIDEVVSAPDMRQTHQQQIPYGYETGHCPHEGHDCKKHKRQAPSKVATKRKWLSKKIHLRRERSRIPKNGHMQNEHHLPAIDRVNWVPILEYDECDADDYSISWETSTCVSSWSWWSSW